MQDVHKVFSLSWWITFISFKALINRFSSKCISIRGCQNVSAHFLPSLEVSLGRSPDTQPSDRWDHAAGCREGRCASSLCHAPTAWANCSHSDASASGVLSFTKSFSYLYFLLKELQWSSPFVKKMCAGIKNPILMLSQWNCCRLRCKWEQKLGYNNLKTFWGYHFAQHSFISVTWCVTYSPHIILQFPDRTVTFSDTLSALLSKLPKWKAKTLK